MPPQSGLSVRGNMVVVTTCSRPPSATSCARRRSGDAQREKQDADEQN